MKSNELRLGNYVTTLTGNDIKLPTMITEKIGMVSFFAVDLYDYKKSFAEQENFRKESMINLYPIPLTEEWLIKFGFGCEEKTGNKENFRFYSKGFITFNTSHNKFYIKHRVAESIKHVHQLQNLYFVLTGKELVALVDG